MGDTTGISWTDSTWNPLRGCSRISPGCAHCYAADIAARFSGPGQPYDGFATKNGHGEWTGAVRLIESALEQPLHWKTPRKIFVNSMSDLFHENVPDEWIDRIFTIMALTPQHIYQVLTKRATRMHDYLHFLRHRMGGPRSWFEHIPQAQQDTLDSNPPPWPLPNVWLGVSVENQRMADERIPWLLETPAAVRFLSCEPLLEDIALPMRVLPGRTQLIHWIIVGGESGKHRRPMKLEWLQSIVSQCQAADIPCFVKQDAALRPGQQGRLSDELWALKEFPHGMVPGGRA